MEYNLRISDADIRMEIDPHRENNSLTAVIGEQEYRVSYEAVSENRIYMVVDDGKEKIGMDAYVAQTADGKVIHINGGVCMVSDNDDSSRQQRKKKRGRRSSGPGYAAHAVSGHIRSGKNRGHRGEGTGGRGGFRHENGDHPHGALCRESKKRQCRRGGQGGPGRYSGGY